MFDDYFNELDPVKRKEILDALQPEPGEEQTLDEIRRLFSVRYTPGKKEGYDDGFIVNLVNIRNIAYNPRERFGSRQDAKDVKRAVHALCLDRTDEFSEDVLYHEMCQLISLYIDTCLDDNHYQAILFGLGHLKRDQLQAKLGMDMHYFWDPVQKFMDEDSYSFYKNAIIDTMEKYNLKA